MLLSSLPATFPSADMMQCKAMIVVFSWQREELLGVAFNRIMRMDPGTGDHIKTWRYNTMKVCCCLVRTRCKTFPFRTRLTAPVTSQPVPKHFPTHISSQSSTLWYTPQHTSQEILSTQHNTWLAHAPPHLYLQWWSQWGMANTGCGEDTVRKNCEEWWWQWK